MVLRWLKSKIIFWTLNKVMRYAGHAADGPELRIYWQGPAEPTRFIDLIEGTVTGLGCKLESIIFSFTDNKREHRLSIDRLRLQYTPEQLQKLEHFRGWSDDERVQFSVDLGCDPEFKTCPSLKVSINDSLLKDEHSFKQEFLDEVLNIVDPIYGFWTSTSEAKGVDLDVGIFDSKNMLQMDDFAIEKIFLDTQQTQEFASGKLRDVYRWNLLSQVHLEAIVEGKPLAEWIAEGNRGQLTKVKPGLYSWAVEKDDRQGLRLALLKADVFVKERDLDDDEADNEDEFEVPERRSVDIAKRDALLKRIGRPDRLHSRRPQVSLEEFFDGNTCQGSIFCNLLEPIAPEEAFTILKSIRDRDDVHDVRVVVTDDYDPMGPDESGIDDDWPFSDTVLFVTSAHADDVWNWLVDVPASEVDKTDEYKGKIPIGMQAVAAWWD